jgi:hypothetical protein
MMTATVSLSYSPAGRIMCGLQILTRSPFRFGRAVFVYVIENFYKGFEQNGCRRFQEHYEFIRSIVPTEILVEYHASEGWNPACEFLGHTIPSGEFPKGNSKASLDGRIQAYMRDERRSIKGLGLMFAMLVVLGIGV